MRSKEDTVSILTALQVKKIEFALRLRQIHVFLETQFLFVRWIAFVFLSILESLGFLKRLVKYFLEK